MMTERETDGARIERGVVIEYDDRKCRVASTDRPGIVTPLFRCDTELTVGDEVAFCMWEDGRGGVFFRFED